MNNIVVISGPSGSGKSTLIDMLTGKHPEIVFSVSHTTRSPREGELDGREYHFIGRERFLEKIENDEFVEWAKVHDKYYGTSLWEVREKSGGSQYLMLDIDVQGARIMRGKFPDALYILVAPPSMAELKNRILKREKQLSLEFERRLRIARDELKEHAMYDYVIINDGLDQSFAALDAVYTAYKYAAPRHADRIRRMIEEE
jgi:guanylate kinase